ncbi:hypothetical protein N8865_02905 [Francisellaceae bacterium]|nr:hypothetical protein [Francisellaceae bacterium]
MNRNKNRSKKLSTLCALAIGSSFLFGGVALADYNPDQATTINLFSEGLSLGVAAHEGNPAEIFSGSMEIMNQLSKVPGLGFLSDITGGEPTSLGEIAGMLETIEKQLGDMKIQLSDIQQTVDQIEDTQVTSLFDEKEQGYSKVLNGDIQPSYDELKGLTFKGVKTYTTLSQALSAKDPWFLLDISNLYGPNGIYEANLNNLSTNVYKISDDGTDLKSDTISKMMEYLQEAYGYQFNHLDAGGNAVPLFTQYNQDVTGIYINILDGLQKAYTVESAIIRINMAIKDYNTSHPSILPITGINLTPPPRVHFSSNTPDTEQDLKNVKDYFKNRVALLKAQFTKSVNDGGYLIPNVDFRLGSGNTVMYYRNSYDPSATSGPTAANGEIYLASIKGYQDYKKSMWDLAIDPSGKESTAHWIYGSKDLPEQISGEQTDFSEDHSPMANIIMDANAMAEGHSNAVRTICSTIIMGNQNCYDIEPYWIRQFSNPYYLYISRNVKGNLISFGEYTSRVWQNPHFKTSYPIPSNNEDSSFQTTTQLPAQANILSLVPQLYYDLNRSEIPEACKGQGLNCHTELQSFTKADLISRYLNIFNHMNVVPSSNLKLDKDSNSVTYTSTHLSPGSMTQPLTVKYQTSDTTDTDAQLYLLQGGMEYTPGSSASDYTGDVFKETYIPRLVLNPNPKASNDVASAMVPADIMSSESTYKPGKTLWYLTMPKSDHLAGNYLQMQTDGNLVEYSKEGDNGYQALWSSAKAAGYNTGSGQPGVLTIQSDGNVVVYHNNGTTKSPALGIPLWSTGRPCTGINSMDPDSCQISPAVNK